MTGSTTYYLVYEDEQAPADKPVGLFRRIRDDQGQIIASDSYHPGSGWSLNNYWVGVTMRGHDELHLVEADEDRAVQAQEYFLALHRDT
jgi:hypothetical protein